MNSNIISMVLLFYTFVAFVTTIAADEKGYLVSEYSDIECNDPSTAIPECSGFLDYKIANFSFLLPNVTGLFAEMREAIPIVFPSYPPGKCGNRAKKFYCESTYPFRCLDKYYGIDTAAMHKTCHEGKAACSHLLSKEDLESRFNCSSIDENFDLLKSVKIPREASCVVFPVVKNDQYSCKTNFKVIYTICFLTEGSQVRLTKVRQTALICRHLFWL